MRTVMLALGWLVIFFIGFFVVGGLIRKHLAKTHAAVPARSISALPADLPATDAATQPKPMAVEIPRQVTAPLASVTVARESPPAAASADECPRPVKTWLEAQIELARRGFSCGPIDGVAGSQSVSALRAFQESSGLATTGELDPATCESLMLTEPACAPMSLTAEDLAALQPISPTWLGKSQQTALGYENAIELVAERTHAHPALIQQLNPTLDLSAITAGTIIAAPAVGRVALHGKAAMLHVSLDDHVLEARDDAGNLLAHFPVSIAHDVEKRPAGELHVTVLIRNPNYTFDPDVFPESEEARELGRKLIIPPGPNNPVGVVWIGLDRPGYGIHGTPFPEQVGRTESHGCFRLANWDALTLLDLAWVGLPVVVQR
jgi:lipoprotein-anchoring transpeptidase ErfK/SrfK